MAELTATYRLQMTAAFTLAHARARVDYFARLGVSHLYLSPILTARRGSTHGYDVVDPSRINPEIGTEEDLRALSAELRQRDMGLIVDIVPNHMGIGVENPQWEDVLAHGERSRFARWFDIEWGEAHKVVLPVLVDDLDAVLERGELSVRVSEAATPRVVYHEQSFPLDPTALPAELQLATVDPAETGELARLFSGTEGRERLRALLELQHYRLISWRRGPAEINYRRFFDVNDLAAVRVEDPEVFAETHALILALVNDGVIDGLRVDHIDGLRDPLGYLRRLRDAVPAAAPIFVEKILSGDEELRRDWPVQGTTGYEFLNDLEDVLIDPNGYRAIEGAYRRSRRLGATSFHEIARAGKVRVLRGALRADVERLASRVVPLARETGKKWALPDIASGLVELIASLPVYRTYIDGHQAIDDVERARIESATRDAMAQAPTLAEQITFIRDLLLDDVSSADPAARLTFVQRFQQVSGPATAKGVEDTALYVYVPLASRNEVGGAPDEPLERAVEHLHAANAERAAHWPSSLLATNTHDTKRSADVRARLDAISELSKEWERSVHRWRRLNARHRATVSGRIAPDTNSEYLLYQTLVALWPPPRSGRRVDDLPDRAWRDAARERLRRYMLKAAREAKIRTNWIDPDSAFETALDDFIGKIFEPADDAPFLNDVARFVSRIATAAAWNSLSRIAVHLTAPGTPDIYHGDELWNFTLVDPDNRRPVDYDERVRLLAEIENLRELPAPFDHRAKLLVTASLLKLRRQRADLFSQGDYVPIAATGPRAAHVIAFARIRGDQFCLTLATRLPSGLVGTDSAGWWQDTRVELPVRLLGRPVRSVLFGDTVEVGNSLELASLVRSMPIAIFADSLPHGA